MWLPSSPRRKATSFTTTSWKAPASTAIRASSTRLSRLRRKGGRPGERPHLPRPCVGRIARVRFARRPLVGGPEVRRLGRTGGAVAGSPLGPFPRPLRIVGGHPSHLPAGSQNRGGRLVSPHHSAFRLGHPTRALPLPRLLGCL